MEEIIRYVGGNYPTLIRLTIEHLRGGSHPHRRANRQIFITTTIAI